MPSNAGAGGRQVGCRGALATLGDDGVEADVRRLMRTGGIVVREVAAQQASEMPIVDHDDVIEAFSTNRADEDLAHPKTLHPACEHIAIDGIPIAEEVLGRHLFWEALDQLASGPEGSGVIGNVDMDEFATVVSKNQEAEEQLEGEGRDNEEVDGDNLADMCLKKGAPRRRWPRRGTPR
jgi:hypothetical protein